LATTAQNCITQVCPVKTFLLLRCHGKWEQQVFEDVFHAVVDKAQMIAGRMKKQFKNPLRIIDASVISLCLTKYNRASCRKAKGVVKLHLKQDGDNLMPYNAYLSTGKIHDIHGMAGLCNESGVIYVPGRGHVDYKSLYNIDLQGSTFVIRMKRNGAYKRIKNNRHEKNGAILSDVLIQLTGPKTKKHYPEPMRKIRYYDKKYHHMDEFITSNMETETQEITDIYKRRWQVELLFKWIKQNLVVIYKV
jgi:hypothetical protein